MARPWPIVEYAQKIGKNTAEFTVKDMVAFMKWDMAQPQQKDLPIMAKSYTTKKYKDAQTSRLAEQGIESPINDGEEEIIIHEDEVIVEMELTQVDINALVWAFNAVLNDYNMTGSAHEKPLTDLRDNLLGLVVEEGV